MSSTFTIPVVVLPEAAARIEELGQRPEFERMIEHTIETLPNLRSIEVRLDLPYDTGDETSISIYAFLRRTWSLEDTTWKNWSDWKTASFPTDVWRWYQIQPCFDA